MSVGDVAGLIAAIGFFVLVAVLSYPLVKLGSTIDELRIAVRRLSDSTEPLIGEVTTTVSSTNAQLGKVDTITSNVANTTSNVSALTSLFATTLGSPIVRVAAFSYGVRRTLANRRNRQGRHGL